MVYKLVFQIPYDDEWWDPDVADELRVSTPGEPHGPHVKIYPDRVDQETGEGCAFIRCKHRSLADLERLVATVLPRLAELVPRDDQ